MKYIAPILLILILSPQVSHADSLFFNLTDDSNDILYEDTSGDNKDQSVIDIVRLNFILEEDLLTVQLTTVGNILVSLPNSGVDSMAYELGFDASYNCLLSSCQFKGVFIHYRIDHTGTYFEAEDDQGSIVKSSEQNEHFQLQNNTFRFSFSIQGDQKTAFTQSKDRTSYTYNAHTYLFMTGGGIYYDNCEYFKGNIYSFLPTFLLFLTLIGVIGIFLFKKKNKKIAP